MDKKSLSERDICTKFIAPAIQQAGWDNAHAYTDKEQLATSSVIT
jgi:type I site-specific restriction endonuclease